MIHHGGLIANESTSPKPKTNAQLTVRQPPHEQRTTMQDMAAVTAAKIREKEVDNK